MPPWLVLAALFSLIVALIYQLVTRRFGWRVLFYWVVTLFGLLVAEAAAEAVGFEMTRYGDLRILPDTVGALGSIAVLWSLKL
ncbi:MAG: hypothetical protein NVS2B16_23930 [Chloroflexota bacterium]